MIEVLSDSGGRAGDAFHLAQGRSLEVALLPARGLGAHHLFEVSVEPLVRVELGAEGRQEGHLDVLAVLFQSLLYRPSVVDTEIVEDQENIPLGISSQMSQKAWPSPYPDKPIQAEKTSMPAESRTLPPDIPVDGLKHDWELLDKYQAFSAELLRMSLAGIGAVGFLVTALAGKDSLLNIEGVPPTSRLAMAVTLLALGLSAGAALAHRFVSSDSMACHIRLLRMELREEPDEDIKSERASRQVRLKLSGLLLSLSGLLLFVGALALAISFIALLKTIAG